MTERDPIGLARDEGRELFAAMERSRLALAVELRETRQVGENLALASVTAVEAIAETVEALSPSLPAGAKRVLAAALGVAWGHLQRAGLDREADTGEVVDISRHRVVRSSAPPGTLPNRITAVWRPGIVFRGRRVRPAEVEAEHVEGFDGADRH